MGIRGEIYISLFSPDYFKKLSAITTQKKLETISINTLDQLIEYGTFYRVEGELISSNQVRLSVVTIWLKRNLDHQFQFITLKPRKEK
ncbi:MAG: hypothetical protein ACKPA9_00965 [Microcystis sp.]